jgi:DNA processing protein
VNFDKEEKIARLQLIRTPQVGPVTFGNLIDQFGSGVEALENIGAASLRGGRAKPLAAPSRAKIEDEISATEKIGGHFIFHGEANYPKLLGAVEPAPPVLICRGHPHLFEKQAVGMVGARNASANGRKMANTLARGLGEAGYVIASGMARGIDTAAHVGALKTGTVAVLAGGVNSIYPPENEDLYHQICERGVVVAEMPLGYTAKARDFPRRNRLISGLSLGVVVVEAALRSGSLITARLAGEQSRDVFAVPGSPLDPRARGCNQLLKESAILAETVEDITDILESSHLPHFDEPSSHDDATPSALTKVEPEVADKFRKTIEELLGPSPCEIDDLVRESGAPAGVVRVVLLELDLAERLDYVPGGKVALKV